MFPNTFYLVNHVPYNTRSDALFVLFCLFSLLWEQSCRLVKELNISQQGRGTDPGEVPAPCLLLLHPSIKSALGFTLFILSEPFSLLPRAHTWGQTCIVRCVLTIGFSFMSCHLLSSHDELKESQTLFVHSFIHQIGVTSYNMSGQVQRAGDPTHSSSFPLSIGI